MSGGSYNYIYYKIEEELSGRMLDDELNEMVDDFVKLCKELEWYCSADSGEESYRNEVSRFKAKWFKQDRSERLKAIIEKRCENLKSELFKMI